MGLWEMIIKQTKISDFQIDQSFLIKGILVSKDYKVRESF
jgi:hypothetical protein